MSWPASYADAWIGLLEAHKHVVRAVEGELEARHRLSLSSLEILGRLSAAGGRRLRLSQVAEATGLSLSRVSRIVDALEARGLVRREPCAEDARAVEAQLTEAGSELQQAAEATHFAAVQERFFDQLLPDEIDTLAVVFRRLAPRAAVECHTTTAPGSARAGGVG